MMAGLLAFAAAVCGVLGAWEALAAVERSRVAAWLVRAVEPLARVGREGREPTPPERRRLWLLAGGVLLAGGWVLGGPAVALPAAAAGPAGTVAVVRARRRRWAAELARGAPEVARALADALGAGHAVRGAIGAAAPGVGGAAGRELRLTAHALAVGAPTEAALEALRARAASTAWDTMIAGVLLQRDAGGDLAGLLRGMAGALEAAARAERDARAATAQARFTAQLVLLLPLGAAALTELASPGLIGSLVADPFAATLAGAAAALQLAAMIAIRRLARPA
jgi:tight adherence protein B